MKKYRYPIYFGLVLVAITLTRFFAAGKFNSPSSKHITSPPSETTMTMDHSSTSTTIRDHRNMDLVPADENYDLRFIDAMIIHHEGAVVMALC